MGATFTCFSIPYVGARVAYAHAFLCVFSTLTFYIMTFFLFTWKLCLSSLLDLKHQ